MRYKLTFDKPHPKGMWILAVVLMLMTTAMAAVVNGFVPYATRQLWLNHNQAETLTLSAFLFLINFASIAGGILGYHYNNRRCVVAGGLFVAMGLGFIAVPNLALIGIVVYAVGVGTMGPNIYTLLSQLYAVDNPKRLAGFMVLFLAANAGYFISVALVDILPRFVSYKTFFQISAVFALLAVYVFLFAQEEFKKKIGFKPKPARHTFVSLLLTLVVLTFIANKLLQQPLVSIICMLVLAVSGILFIVLICRNHSPSPLKPRSYILVFMLVISTSFWLANRISLIIFSHYEYLLDTPLFNNKQLPDNILFAINAIVIIVFGIFLGRMWHRRKNKTGARTILRLFAIALVLASLTYTVFWLSEHQLIDNNMLRSSVIIVATLLISISEVLLAPVYFATAGKFAPREYESIVIGIQQLFIGLMGSLAVILTHQSSRLNLMINIDYLPLNILDLCSALALTLAACAVITYISIYLWRD